MVEDIGEQGRITVRIVRAVYGPAPHMWRWTVTQQAAATAMVG